MGQLNNIVLTSDENFSKARCNKSRVNIWAQLETVYPTGTTLKKIFLHHWSHSVLVNISSCSKIIGNSVGFVAQW